MLRLGHSKRAGQQAGAVASKPKGEPTHERKFLQAARIRQAPDLGRAAQRVGSKKARHPLKQVTGLQDEFPNVHLVSQFTTERR